MRTLRDHIKQSHDKEISCDSCGKSFSNKRELIDHIETDHMSLKFSCNLCSAEFRSAEKLKNHKRITHNKNHKCEKCNAAFGKPHLLVEHVKVKHEGLRFHCSYPGCSGTFVSSSYAKKHLQKIH